MEINIHINTSHLILPLPHPLPNLPTPQDVPKERVEATSREPIRARSPDGTGPEWSVCPLFLFFGDTKDTTGQAKSPPSLTASYLLPLPHLNPSPPPTPISLPLSLPPPTTLPSHLYPLPTTPQTSCRRQYRSTVFSASRVAKVCAETGGGGGSDDMCMRERSLFSSFIEEEGE